MTTTKRRGPVRGPSIARNVGRLSTLRGHIKSPSKNPKAYPYKNKRY